MTQSLVKTQFNVTIHRLITVDTKPRNTGPILDRPAQNQFLIKGYNKININDCPEVKLIILNTDNR